VFQKGLALKRPQSRYSVEFVAKPRCLFATGPDVRLVNLWRSAAQSASASGTHASLSGYAAQGTGANGGVLLLAAKRTRRLWRQSVENDPEPT
jgi:hypothetical protein